MLPGIMVLVLRIFSESNLDIAKVCSFSSSTCNDQNIVACQIPVDDAIGM